MKKNLMEAALPPEAVTKESTRERRVPHPGTSGQREGRQMRNPAQYQEQSPSMRLLFSMRCVGAITQLCAIVQLENTPNERTQARKRTGLYTR
jgi:hypothetical protein